MNVISSNSQSRWKDSVASAPSLDLCLIANGEEKTQILSSKGVLAFAGLEAPTTAPGVADAGSGNLTAGKWVCYVYVYAATTRYPLAQSSQGAGGNLSPRSNASPRSAAIQMVSTNRKINVTVTKTLRPDISKIWIYRTQLLSTQQLAQTAAEAGLLFFLAAVTNDGTPGTVTYLDNSLSVQEQIESDNLVAPTAQFCVYYDPYFFLFGQNELNVEVDLTAAGVMTVVSSFDGTWFDGRNGQFVKLQGVTTGGFDGFGTFYFKWLGPITAQLTIDQAGTTLASATYFGRTKARVYGYSTTLYRSKPNNPFAWGETITIGTAVVSRSWVLKVGGGLGIAMTVIPSSSLLKLDLSDPARSYVFNLKQTQTDAFKSTRRQLSDTYIPSGNFCQFNGLDQNRSLQTFAIDSRNFTITQTDGGSVGPIGDSVQLELRKIIQTSSEHVHFHGVYDPNSELNCWFYRQANGLPTIHKMIYQHAPSGQWGTWDCFDILCSTQVQDEFTGKTVILGGNSVGMVGQLFFPQKGKLWIEDGPAYFNFGQVVDASNVTQKLKITPPTNTTDLVGRYFVITTTYLGAAQYNVFWYNDGTGSDPGYIVPYTQGSNYVINSVPIAFSVGFSQHSIALNIASAISSAIGPGSGSIPNFGLTNDTVGGGDGFITINWTRPVLYSIPLNQYFDVNSGTTFELTQNGGAYLTYSSGEVESAIDFTLLNGIVGNWAIVEHISSTTSDTDGTGKLLWGRIADLYSDGNDDDGWFVHVKFDLMYRTFQQDFIYSILDFISLGFPQGQIVLGTTECLLRKYLDFGEASEIKNLNEIWATMNNFAVGIDIPLLGYIEQFSEISNFPKTRNIFTEDVTVQSTPTNAWFIRQPIHISPFKTFGFDIIERGPKNFRILNITLKV